MYITGHDEMPIGGKGHAAHLAGLALECLEELATAHLPQASYPVSEASEHLLPIGGEGCAHRVEMALECLEELATVHLPQVSSVSTFANDEHLLSIGGEGCAAHRRGEHTAVVIALECPKSLEELAVAHLP